MDSNITNITSTGSLVMLICYMVYKIFKHSHCRSVCCGSKTQIDIDLEDQSPATRQLTPKTKIDA